MIQLLKGKCLCMLLETIHGLMHLIWLLLMNKLLKGKYLGMLFETIHGLMRAIILAAAHDKIT